MRMGLHGSQSEAVWRRGETMGILLANLKQFYQRHSLYWVYVPLGLFLFFGVLLPSLKEMPVSEGGLAGLLIPAFLVGVMVGAMQIEVVSKPFSFCLPGHRDAVRRLTFLIGISLSLVLAPRLFNTSLFVSGPPVSELVLLSGFCANLAAYLAGVVFGLSVWNVTSVIGLVILAYFVLGDLGSGMAIERAILYRPIRVIVLGTGVAVVAWLWLGRPAWFRNRCATPWSGLLYPWDRSRMHESRHVWASRRFTKVRHPRTEGFFLGRIAKHGNSDSRKYVWGTLYTTYALIAPQWKGLLSLVLMIVVWIGYVQAVPPVIIPILGLIMTGFIHPPLYSELPVVGGRWTKSFATMVQILTLAVVWTLVLGLAVLVVNSMMSVMSLTTAENLQLSFPTAGLNLWLLPMMIFPIMGIVRVLFYRNAINLMVGTILVLGTMMAVSLLTPWEWVSPPMAHAAAVIAVLWGICFLIVHAVAMRSDLGRR
jgi:hypothetical protein